MRNVISSSVAKRLNKYKSIFLNICKGENRGQNYTKKFNYLLYVMPNKFKLNLISKLYKNEKAAHFIEQLIFL